jgi:hypothetical protein
MDFIKPATPTAAIGVLSGSENRGHAGSGDKMQVSRIGWIAQQTERLASSRRRSLPGHVILPGGSICISIRQRDLEDHSHQPRADRRKWKFFGLNNSRDTSMITGRRLRRRRGRKHCGCKPCGRGIGEFHGALRLAVLERGNVARDFEEIACGDGQNQAARLNPVGPRKAVCFLIRCDRDWDRWEFGVATSVRCNIFKAVLKSIADARFGD